MERRVALSSDAQQAFAAGAALCRRANLAIFTPEHLLAGALLALQEAGVPGLPGPADVALALDLIHATAEDTPPDDVSFGPGATAVLDAVALGVVEAGGDTISARDLATGVLLSGEATPMFVTSMGTSREALLSLLTAGSA